MRIPKNRPGPIDLYIHIIPGPMAAELSSFAPCIVVLIAYFATMYLVDRGKST